MSEAKDPRYTIKEAARLLEMSHQATYSAIDRGALTVREEDEFRMTKKVYRFLRLTEINRYRMTVQGKEPLTEREAQDRLRDEEATGTERNWSRQELVAVGSV